MSESTKAQPLSDVWETVQRLRDKVITQAFVAGQMDAQYTAAVVLRHEVGSPLKLLKARAYALALETMEELVALLPQQQAEPCVWRENGTITWAGCRDQWKTRWYPHPDINEWKACPYCGHPLQVQRP